MKMKKPSTLYVDADSIIYLSASAVEDTYIEVEHKETGWKRKFSNVTEFHGHHLKKEGGWIGKQNAKRGDGNKISSDDFNITHKAKLKKGKRESLKDAMINLRSQYTKLRNLGIAEEVVFVIGGGKNYREDLAHTLEYKGNRDKTKRPLLLKDLRERASLAVEGNILSTWNEEADDFVARKGYESYQEFKKSGWYPYAISYIDKDLDMTPPCPRINYNKLEEGVFIPTYEQTAREYLVQLLEGDKGTDNIQGLPSLPEEMFKEYGLRKTKGVGEKTARGVVDFHEDINEALLAVERAYKGFYGEEYTFTSWRGEELTWSYLDFMQETSNLICMSWAEGELFDIREALDKARNGKEWWL